MDQSIPTHLGIIPDGNRRWAKAAGLPPMEGHRKGHTRFHALATHAAAKGIRYVSVYIFSTENWARTTEEVSFLMDLVVWIATKEVDIYDKEGFKLIFLGSKDRLSARVLKAVESAEVKTRHNTGTVLAFCFNYGGHTEIAEGVARMIQDGVPAGEVTPERIESYLYYPEIPPIDLVIRTSGEQRLSNFMLWRAAYAELYFEPVLWPEFTTAHLDAALDEFARRRRRYGA